MNYEEAYEAGYAIGFHKEKMAQEGNWSAVATDQDYLVELTETYGQWATVLIHRYEQAIAEVDNGIV